MKTAIANYFEDTEKQAEEWLGRVTFFIMLDNIHTRGWRIGQAFHNALPEHDSELLNGTDADPFYFDSWESVQKAIDYLLEHS